MEEWNNMLTAQETSIMDFEFKPLSLDQAVSAKLDALVLALPDTLLEVQAGSAGTHLLSWITKVLKAGSLETGTGQLIASHMGSQCVANRLVLVRVGDGSALSMRKAMLAAFATLRQSDVHKVALFTGLVAPQPGALRAALVAAAEATYSYTTTLSKPKARSLTKLTLVATDAGDAHQQFDEAVALVKGTELAKEWANRPGNHATPTLLADAAQKLGKFDNFHVEVLGPKEVAKLGMGAFMAVAQGSEEPLRFIVIHYNGAGKSHAPVVLVGKGVTFDTGGISIKPAAEMDEMKYDMGGAASVLGTLRAIAELQPAINVVGIIPSCENMPDGRAIKPGDVVTSMSGQTIEILNTDAEGRLILCDALTYAARFKPACTIDIATLTGACVIALGGVRSGMFTNEADLAEQLAKAGDAALDPCWRLPLDDEYGEGLKSKFADMGNVAGRAGGAISAAKFLQKFTTDMRWAHLDVAGTAWKSGAAKGATGRPVGLLVQFILDQAKDQVSGTVESVAADAGDAPVAHSGKTKSAGKGRRKAS
jgi:leucyl aminopeptidase